MPQKLAVELFVNNSILKLVHGSFLPTRFWFHYLFTACKCTVCKYSIT
jgi:hypothetical protein